MVLDDGDYKADPSTPANSPEAKARRDELFDHKFQDIIGYIVASQDLIMALEKKAQQYPEMDSEIAEAIRSEQATIKRYQRELKDMGF